MSPATGRLSRFDGFAGAGAGAVSFALSSGQATPRSGSGARGALGSSSAASGGVDAGGGTAWASKGPESTAEPAAPHSSRAPVNLNPRPLIQGEALTSAPEPRQYVCSACEGL